MAERGTGVPLWVQKVRAGLIMVVCFKLLLLILDQHHRHHRGMSVRKGDHLDPPDQSLPLHGFPRGLQAHEHWGPLNVQMPSRLRLREETTSPSSTSGAGLWWDQQWESSKNAKAAIQTLAWIPSRSNDICTQQCPTHAALSTPNPQQLLPEADWTASPWYNVWVVHSLLPWLSPHLASHTTDSSPKEPRHNGERIHLPGTSGTVATGSHHKLRAPLRTPALNVSTRAAFLDSILWSNYVRFIAKTSACQVFEYQLGTPLLTAFPSVHWWSPTKPLQSSGWERSHLDCAEVKQGFLQQTNWSLLSYKSKTVWDLGMFVLVLLDICEYVSQ